MADLKFEPISHYHAEFIARAKIRPGFTEAYAVLEREFALARQTLDARFMPGAAQGPTKAQPPHTPHCGTQAMRTQARNPYAKPSATVTPTAASGWRVWLAALSLALSLCACGMETAATAAKLQAQQAQAAKQQLDAARQQLEQANAQLQARKQQMDAAAQ